MINELNLTPAQAIIMVILLIVLSAILSHFKSYTVIEIEDDKQTPVRPVSTRYGAYIQSQGRYFN
ncbi:hypothetical protein [Streptococcus catagoni]|uniref:hypothetical protein n=1 Tax=Streptococcus catagoni TaxID=2654874 RepID=UPI00140A1388|nr:hypothetical protein [Streptococcus catagoni]